MNTNTQTSILVIKKNMCKKTKGKFMKQNYKLSNKYGLLTYRTQKKKKKKLLWLHEVFGDHNF